MNDSKNALLVPYGVKFKVIDTNSYHDFDIGDIVERLPKELYDTWGDEWGYDTYAYRKMDDRVSVVFIHPGDIQEIKENDNPVVVQYLCVDDIERIEE